MRSVPDVDTACRPVRIMRSVSWTESLRQICRFVRYVGNAPRSVRRISARQRGESIRFRSLIKELRKDEMFYEESGGGVTLSGGEVSGCVFGGGDGDGQGAAGTVHSSTILLKDGVRILRGENGGGIVYGGGNGDKGDIDDSGVTFNVDTRQSGWKAA